MATILVDDFAGRIQRIPTRMSPQPPDGPDADTREAVKRLIELIQVLAPSRRPGVTMAIERCVLALVIDEMRQRIIERLQHLSSEDIRTVDVLTASLAGQRDDEPPSDAA